jgi:hypothetical protein
LFGLFGEHVTGCGDTLEGKCDTFWECGREHVAEGNGRDWKLLGGFILHGFSINIK